MNAVFYLLCCAFTLLVPAFCLLHPTHHPALGSKVSTWGPTTPEGVLHVAISDRGTGRAAHARCYLNDSSGKSWSPTGALRYVKPPEQHFIAKGSFRISLPPGKYTLRVERGLEYRPATRQFEMRPGETREERVALGRWINMNERGWYSGDLHNHREWREIPELLLAEDLNLAPTLTEWVWEDKPISKSPAATPGSAPTRVVDATHVYSVFDTEIERLRDGPGAVDLVGLSSPVKFQGYLLNPPNSVFAETAHRQGGYVDAEKITWRDTAALVALGGVDFAGIVYNHFHRHGVDTETDAWGMMPKDKPEYATPAGMPLWAMEVYYKFLNCGFRLPVSAGSASNVFPTPLGFNRVYVHLRSRFGYQEWFRDLKAGRSFATNGPIVFLKIDGREPGDTLVLASGGGKPAAHLAVTAEAFSVGDLDRLEIVWKGKVIKTVSARVEHSKLKMSFSNDVKESGWFAARAFERPKEVIRFAHTSPVYVRLGQDVGIVPEDAHFFLNWIDSEIKFYENLSSFRNEADRQAMIGMFRKARKVYERLATGPPK